MIFLLLKFVFDIFFDELPRLPPDGLIDFKIDIMPRVGLIFKLPYKMAPVE